MDDHPCLETLRLWLQERLGEPERDAVSRHVARCKNVCAPILDNMSPFTEEEESAEGDAEWELLPGDWVKEYEIFDLLARGGMALVYRAWSHNARRFIALKMLQRWSRHDPHRLARFRHEIEAVARLGHPNIIVVHDSGTHDGVPYLVMEYADQGTLEARLTNQPVSTMEAARLVELLARASAEAHRQGMVHRDLKPQNVLLCECQAALASSAEQGTVAETGANTAVPDWAAVLGDIVFVPKIADFGLVKIIEEADGVGLNLTSERFLVGTPAYMAPEQARGDLKQIGPPTDVYALGAILYRLLTGKLPAHGLSHHQILQRVIHDEPVAPRQICSSIPRDLESICLACLEKNPSRRYSDGAALAEDLARFRQGLPTLARPTGPVERFWNFCRRKPATAGLVASLCLALVGGGFAVLHEWFKTDRALKEAEANAAQAQDFLTELVASFVDRQFLDAAILDDQKLQALQREEEQCSRALNKWPQNEQIRLGLAGLRRGLADQFRVRCQTERAFRYLTSILTLWGPEGLNASNSTEARISLSNTMGQIALAEHARGNYRQAFQINWDALGRMLRINESQPGDWTIIQGTEAKVLGLRGLIETRPERDQVMDLMESLQDELDRSVQKNAFDRIQLWQQALVTFLGAEATRNRPDLQRAIPRYREAARHFERLLESQGGGFLAEMWLAECEIWSIAGSHKDQYLTSAAKHFDDLARQLRPRLKQRSITGWEFRRLADLSCSLALCYWRGGQADKAERVFGEFIEDSETHLDDASLSFEKKIHCLAAIVNLEIRLRESKLEGAALLVARRAGRQALQLVQSPTRDFQSCQALAQHMVQLGTLLRQLQAPGEALQQLDPARALYQGLVRALPEAGDYVLGLATIWTFTGKAQWDLGMRSQALASFEEAARVERRLFEREPSNQRYREQLSRCYDRIFDWARQMDDRIRAETALHELEKLWLQNPGELRYVAKNYREFAKTIGESKKNLSDADQAQQKKYLVESDRLEQLANKVAAEEARR